jgi:hypothetical protein
MKKLILLSLLVGLTLSVSAQTWGNGIKGTGPITSKKVSLETIEGIQLSISADVFLTQSTSQLIEIKGQQNIIDNIEMTVKKGICHIDFKKNVRNYDDLEIYISLANLRKVGVNGSGDVMGRTSFSSKDNIDIFVSGSGNIKLDVEAASIDCSISGSGDIELSGQCADQNISITGSGDYTAYDLLSTNCNVSITGSGDAKVQVNTELNASVVGSGDVLYTGNADVRSKIVGSGDVMKKGK